MDIFSNPIRGDSNNSSLSPCSMPVASLLLRKQLKTTRLPFLVGVANGKSETRRDAETGTLKSETETEKFSDLIEKHICDRQTQNLRL